MGLARRAPVRAGRAAPRRLLDPAGRGRPPPERWGNFPHERERFYALLRETRASGVVVLSGDRHFGAIYREATATPYPLIDVTASPICRPSRNNREPGPNRIGDTYRAENFGTADIDWERRRLVLSVRSADGEPVRRIELGFDELQARG